MRILTDDVGDSIVGELMEKSKESTGKTTPPRERRRRQRELRRPSGTYRLSRQALGLGENLPKLYLPNVQGRHVQFIAHGSLFEDTDRPDMEPHSSSLPQQKHIPITDVLVSGGAILLGVILISIGILKGIFFYGIMGFFLFLASIVHLAAMKE